ncbi:MAG TPA: O-antigen ligase family protein, partial [Anaerolineales bacterium]|nr:O-antigen ligase family protein [Anaerolineales bacterium]
FLRAYGLSDHPNILGGCLSFGLILLLAVFLYGNKRSAWISAPIFLLGFAALVMTFSRSAWLSLMVAASFMVGCEALARRWDLVRRAILLGGVGILVLLPFFVSHIEAFQSRAHAGDVMGDEQIKERLFLMEKGNTLFVEHSAIGVGLGASPLAMKKRFGEFPINIQPPHYAILTAVLEIGLFGGMFYGILMLLPFLNFAFRWRSFIDQPFMKAAVGLLLAICIVGVFDYYTWFYAPGRLWQWLAWGLYSSVSTKAG